MPPYYYSKPIHRVRRKRSWRPFLGAIIVGAVGVLTVQAVQYIAQPHVKAHVDSDLQSAIDTWAAQQPFKTSVSVIELTGDLRTAAHLDQATMIPASTYKLFVAYAVLKQAESGKLNLSGRVRTGQTAQQALSKMILQSDNASAEALGALVGWNTVDTMAADIGAIQTDIDNYDTSGNATQGDKQTTTADLALLLTRLQQGTLLSASDTQLLLGLMKQQAWRERVPSGTPSTVVVADKPGWLPNIQNDAAIVYGPKSVYVIVIMSTSSTAKPLADLSRIVYDRLEV